MVAVKRGREEISISGRTLDEIQKQLDKLREEQEKTETENLSQSTADNTGTTHETVTSRETSTIITTENDATTADEKDTEVTAQGYLPEIMTPEQVLDQMENIKTLYIDKKNEVLKRLNVRRAESGWKEINSRYRKHYKDLTDEMKQEYRDALFDTESNEDRATANWLARLYGIIRKHQGKIDQLKLQIERDARPATKRNIALFRDDIVEDNFSTSSLYWDISSFEKEDELTIVSNLTDEEWGSINNDQERNLPENPFAPDYRPDDFLTEIKIASFQRELKKDLKRRFGMDLRQYNILTCNKNVALQRKAVKTVLDAYGSPTKIKNEKLNISVVTDEKPKKRTRI